MHDKFVVSFFLSFWLSFSVVFIFASHNFSRVIQNFDLNYPETAVKGNLPFALPLSKDEFKVEKNAQQRGTGSSARRPSDQCCKN
jgi:hypothetical protein